MQTRNLLTAAGAGTLYFLIMFAIGFVLGTLRVLVIIPAIGAVGAVIVELPVMLGLSWVTSHRLTRTRPGLSDAPSRLTMGATAFALLILAELVLSLTLFARSPAEFQDELGTPHGLIGLAGQVAFALIPWAQLVIATRRDFRRG